MLKRNFGAILLAVMLACLTVGCGEKKTNNTTVTEAPKGPSTEKANLSEVYSLGTDEALILVNAVQSEEKGLVKNGKLYVPVSILASMDGRFYWNAKENRLFFTNAEKRYGFKPGETTHTEGSETVSDSVPQLITSGGVNYFCTDMVKKFGHIKVTEATSPDRILLIEAGHEVLRATVKNPEGAIMRTGRDETYSIIAELPKGTPILLAEELSGNIWTKVVTEDGVIGYVSNLDTTTYDDVIISGDVPEPQYEHQYLGKKVCMAWHGIYSKQGASELKAAIKNTESLNVICPTWLQVSAVDGSVSSFASSDYVNAAHNAGLKVWVLVDDFKEGVPGIEVLESTEHRDTLVANLVREVTACGADGINIDFEYITKDSAPHFLQFLRELYVACRGKNLTLSTDNYYPNRLNEYYKLDQQKDFIDYIIFMGYDEYHKNSTTPGPTASVSFVKGGVSEMLKKVPASQIILGIPFFSRKWVSKTDEDGKETLTSSADGMDAMRSFVKNNGGKFSVDEKTGLNYAAMRTADGLVQIWLEDADAIKHFLNIMKDNQLAGCSAWRLGYESKDTWNVIKSFFAN